MHKVKEKWRAWYDGSWWVDRKGRMGDVAVGERKNEEDKARVNPEKWPINRIHLVNEVE